MAQISITTESLMAAARDCEDANRLIRGEMNKVDSERGAALGQWSGPAAKAFSNLVDAWLREGKKMTDAVEAFHNQLSSTADENVRMEEEQSSTLSNFSNQLGV